MANGSSANMSNSSMDGGDSIVHTQRAGEKHSELKNKEAHGLNKISKNKNVISHFAINNHHNEGNDPASTTNKVTDPLFPTTLRSNRNQFNNTMNGNSALRAISE
jgi:hypothetical protein